MYESETIEVFLEKYDPRIRILTIHFWHFTKQHIILEVKFLGLWNWLLAVGQIYSLGRKMKIYREENEGKIKIADTEVD